MQCIMNIFKYYIKVFNAKKYAFIIIKLDSCGSMIIL